jgi:hypothetical protein
MDKQKTSKLLMARAVKLVCINHQAIVDSMPALKSNADELSTLIDTLTDLESTQQTVITGVTQSKTDFRASMTQQALLISGPFAAYAHKLGLADLEQRVAFAKSDFDRANDTVFMEMCQKLYNEANALAADLADYSITPAQLSQFNNDCLSFEPKIGSTRLALVQRKSATQSLENTMIELDETLILMDGLMQGLMISNPSFVQQYTAARKLQSTSTRTPSLSGKVIDSITLKPINGANIEVIGLGITITSTASGTYRIYGVNSANVKVKITKTGYQEVIIENIPITQGVRTLQDASMVKLS